MGLHGWRSLVCDENTEGKIRTVWNVGDVDDVIAMLASYCICRPTYLVVIRQT